MITQKIIARTDSLKLDKIISRYGEDSMRQVVFIIVRPDPESEELIPITIPEDAVGSFRILKPSGNFVIVPMSKSVLASGETAFDVVLPASANTAKGSGYYDIRITSDTDKYYFTAQGDFIIDDNIISDEVLEDVSEVNGLIFPDDFLTVEDHVAYIDDDTISTDSTWSSNKINEEIEAHAGGDVSKTVSGNPVIFTDGASAPLVKCDVAITGSQDLHGYDKPWVGGAGKNKLENTATTTTINGVTFTSNSDGSVTLSGTATAQTDYIIHSAESNVLPANQTLILTGGVSASISLRSNIDGNNYPCQGSPVTINTTDGSFTGNTYIRVSNGTDTTGITVYPMIRLASVSDATFEPYSNICPISGYSSVGVNVAPTVSDTPQTYIISLGDTYYSAHIDAVRGVLVATSQMEVFDNTATVSFGRASYDNWYYTIASTETLYASVIPISNKYVGASVLNDNDDLGIYKIGSTGQIRVRVGGTKPADTSAFVADLGTTPLQVLYDLPTSLEIPLTPAVISSLLGDNAIWTDGDNLSIEYITQRFQPLIDSIKQL